MLQYARRCHLNVHKYVSLIWLKTVSCAECGVHWTVEAEYEGGFGGDKLFRRRVLQGEFCERKPNGRGSYRYGNGSSSTGTFRIGLLHGAGSVDFLDGSAYTGALSQVWYHFPVFLVMEQAFCNIILLETLYFVYACKFCACWR